MHSICMRNEVLLSLVMLLMVGLALLNLLMLLF